MRRIQEGLRCGTAVSCETGYTHARNRRYREIRCNPANLVLTGIGNIDISFRVLRDSPRLGEIRLRERAALAAASGEKQARNRVTVSVRRNFANAASEEIGNR